MNLTNALIELFLLYLFFVNLNLVEVSKQYLFNSIMDSVIRNWYFTNINIYNFSLLISFSIIKQFWYYLIIVRGSCGFKDSLLFNCSVFWIPAPFLLNSFVSVHMTLYLQLWLVKQSLVLIPTGPLVSTQRRMELIGTALKIN